jgi:hypothetical protein
MRLPSVRPIDARHPGPVTAGLQGDDLHQLNEGLLFEINPADTIWAGVCQAFTVWRPGEMCAPPTVDATKIPSMISSGFCAAPLRLMETSCKSLFACQPGAVRARFDGRINNRLNSFPGTQSAKWIIFFTFRSTGKDAFSSHVYHCP